MNKVILCGRLTADPDVKTKGKGKNAVTIGRFTIAVNSGKEHTDFIRCTAFNGTAELLEEYVYKGDKVLIDGRWQTGSYENDDGETVYTNECVVNRVEFCESRRDDREEETEEEKPKKSSRGK